MKTHGLDDSVLDLSTSKVEIEVQEALSAKGYNATPTWLEVDGAYQSGFLDSAPVEGRNTSLNTAAWDADLFRKAWLRRPVTVNQENKRTSWK